MRAPRIVVIATIAFATATSLVRPTRAQSDVSLETLLVRASAYVTRFIDRFSNVVTEERYEQTWDGPGRHQTRITRSDLIFVKSVAALDWSELRDVFEVDGRAVRDRQDRLLKLFSDPKAAAQPQARRILEESARYNIGPIARTTNTPVFPLVVLMREAQHRFAFTLGGSDDALGPNVRTVAFREIVSPTLVSGDKREDRFSTGQFWLEVDSGRVLKSEINIEVLRNTWTLTTLFSPDDANGVAMPVEMRERVLFDYQSVTGVASYGRFRTFAVSTGESLRRKDE